MGVREPVVVVEHHDGGDHARRHHEHDAVEVGACQRFKKVSQGTPFGGEKNCKECLDICNCDFLLETAFCKFVLERRSHFCKVYVDNIPNALPQDLWYSVIIRRTSPM